jgi:hypothetical protein
MSKDRTDELLEAITEQLVRAKTQLEDLTQAVLALADVLRAAITVPVEGQRPGHVRVKKIP